MRETRTINNCDSVGDLTFIIGEDEYVGLGSVSFIVNQEVIEQIPALKGCYGEFKSKDFESSGKIEIAWDKGNRIEIKGRFRDTLRGNKESDWDIEDVLFTHINAGKSGTFQALKATEYPVGTFTPED